MRKLISLITFFLVIAGPFSVLGVETKFSGFIGIDLMKISKENEKRTEYNNGIGAIDIKFSSYYEKFSSKIKLDLDEKKFEQTYNLFEEASVTYNYSPTMKFEMGKNKVSFYKQIRGAIEASYFDGGSLLGTGQSWYDIDNKNLIEFTYGSKDLGFFNHLTIYGDKYQSKNVNLRTRYGIADNFEFFPMANVTVAVAGVLFRNNAPESNNDGHEDNWAVDTNAQYTRGSFDFFFEYLYGSLSTGNNVKYGAIQATDHIAQVGFEQNFSELLNFLLEVEAAIVDKECNDQEYDDNLKSKHLEQTTVKVEAGVKFKMDRSIFFTTGVLYETASRKIEGVAQPDLNVYQLAGTLSYWF